MSNFLNLNLNRPIVIGMVHLKALPGSPLYSGDMKQVFDHALKDAVALSNGGVDAIMMENFGDIPFTAGAVSSETVAAMTMIACEIKKVTQKPLGINVLRNDAMSAVSIAVASSAEFIRVNVLTGARVTDQGLIQGNAFELMRHKARIGATHIKVMADIDVKHSAPLASRPLADEVEDTIKRGLADSLIVSGAGTGKKSDPKKLNEVMQVAKNSSVFLGSGVTVENLEEYKGITGGFIVGTHFKHNGSLEELVDEKRVKKFMDKLASK